LPDWAWPNFQLGNHDVGRVASRLGSDLVDAMNMIYMLLPGTPITYYGEELGMVDAKLASPTDKRDPARTPMQWSKEANAGNNIIRTFLLNYLCVIKNTEMLRVFL